MFYTERQYLMMTGALLLVTGFWLMAMSSYLVQCPVTRHL